MKIKVILLVITGSFLFSCSFLAGPVPKIQDESASSPANIYTLRDTGPANGWVFYDKGSYSDGWRYLEAAPADQLQSTWGDNTTLLLGANGTAVGTGTQNTLDIISEDITANKAADQCEAYSISNNGINFTDWFLPSKNELAQMYIELKDQVPSVGGFAPGIYYWSSSQSAITSAWGQHSGTNLQSNQPKTNSFKVRCIRSF